MNMRVAKEEIALLMPASLSHYADEPRLNETQARPGVFGAVARAVNYLLDLPRRHAVVAELAALSDRELTDIGLSRADLARVFDPNFAARQTGNRARTLGSVSLG